MSRECDVFALDMGERAKIIDLAGRMVKPSGLTVQVEFNPDRDIAIALTGLRFCEKLYDEWLIGGKHAPMENPCIMKAQEEFLPWAELQDRLQTRMQAVDANSALEFRQRIQFLVPGYQPEIEVMNWVWLTHGMPSW